MPIRGCGCSGGLWATALVVFLALPVQYYIPDFAKSKEELSVDTLINRASLTSTDYFHWLSLENIPIFDLFLTVTLLVLAIFTYLCDWIQRKLMERRIVKLNQYLSHSVERLRVWDARREQLEGTLRAARHATAEYNLLLYLLLRRRRAPHKDLDGLGFARAPEHDLYHAVNTNTED